MNIWRSLADATSYQPYENISNDLAIVISI